jgi:hypothetical protein
MKQFQFADFIEEFKVTFTAYQESSSGYYNDEGDWVEGEGGLIPVQMTGIVLPLTEDDLKYVEQGTYSVKDRKLYTLQPLKLGIKIEHKGTQYTVQNFKDYSDYADVFIYYARCVE